MHIPHACGQSIRGYLIPKTGNKEAKLMSHQDPNENIRCRVESCAFNCSGAGFCSLHAIQVEPCSGCDSGRAEDESMCASYRRK